MTSERKTITIRRADAFDAANILRLAEIGLKENQVAYPEMVPHLALRWYLETLERGVVWTADLSGRLVGAIGLELAAYPWSPEPHLRDTFFAVLPQFRGYGTADNLLKAAEAFAAEKNLRLMIYFSGGAKSEEKDRWVQQRGFTYAGGTFVRLPPG